MLVLPCIDIVHTTAIVTSSSASGEGPIVQDATSPWQHALVYLDVTASDDIAMIWQGE